MQGVQLTSQEKQKFLQKLAQNLGNVSKAATAAKISRSAAYLYKDKDADFSKAWDDIEAAVADAMEQEMVRRAIKGYQEPVFYKGQMIAKIRKFSDRLLEFGLKGKRPEVYRERFDITQNVTGSLDVNLQIAINQIYDDGKDEAAESPELDAGTDPDS